MSEEKKFKYDVALSFAGEQREYVEKVARGLKGFGVSCFYDFDEISSLWGKNGIEVLNKTYEEESRVVVMFVSSEYVNKPWCKVERRAALSARMEHDKDSVLQVVFDKVKVPGIPTSEIYVEAENYVPGELAVLICQAIGVDVASMKADITAAPVSPEESGTVRCRVDSCNGRQVIGQGNWSFETRWDRASDETIHIYNDGSTVVGVAFASDCWEAADVKNAVAHNFTSRVITPRNGSLVVLKNKFGFYALLRIEYIADSTRAAWYDEVIFSYRILRDHSEDFSKVEPFSPLGPSISLDFDLDGGTLMIRNTFNEPVKFYAIATNTFGIPPSPPEKQFKELPSKTIAPSKALTGIACRFSMAPLVPGRRSVSTLYMDVYISDIVDNFYKARFILKITCRGNPKSEAQFVSAKTRLESTEAL
ncbi:TIR domain-containing protein [Candidatus Symbiopectobacterium sp. NZEC135]|uniref:TIR domain-containing protein n=1 Tax=Candidatus Symbiopectobacterium sp. NZEC135 TaxID=2820471 RepID=UPI002226DD52|nr:TIR domain-containing protein [Candidatus Symbiopectobacterium sp. NZEC135]MCW2478031.1 TIR domain-containing protein [Candidatus Symbiopectobacterium sp. NZEC135]